MARLITPEESQLVDTLLARGRAAMKAIDGFDQATVDRLCQAVAWAAANEVTATRLAQMSVQESGMGSPEPGRRGKVLGILRDALRQKSIGIIEELPEKGIVKYAKPAGVIASLIPVTSPYITPIGIAIYAIKCKDAVIFSPHPSSRNTTNETVRLMREALRRQGAPEDLLQCVERPSIPLANDLMAKADLTIATGGPAMVKAAYGSGKPAYGVGAGNATMVIDETADVAEAARNTSISKTNDNGSGCSADGNLLVDSTIYDAFLDALQREGGYLVDDREKALLRAAYWDADGRRTADTIARPASVVAERAGFALPPGKTFFVVPEQQIGTAAPLLDREARHRARDLQVPRLRRCAGQGAADLRNRRQGALLRDLLVRRWAHRRAGADRAGQPHHGAADSIARQRRHLHQRHADDLEHGLRRLGRQHHQREHRAEALHERDLGEPSDSRRQALRSRALRRVLRQRDS